MRLNIFVRSSVAVREWGSLAIKWLSYEIGMDSVQVQTIKKAVANPELHKAWKTRENVFVGGPAYVG